MSDDITYWKPEDDDIVSLTAAALSHVNKCLQQRGQGIGIRFAAVDSGCNGYKYEVSYVDEQQASDKIFKTTDPQVVILVDEDSFKIVKGTQIDYVREGLNEHFVFNNPQQIGSCGCGESFNVS